MSINIFLCTLRLWYMYNIQVQFCQIKVMQDIYICIVSILCTFTCICDGSVQDLYISPAVTRLYL